MDDQQFCLRWNNFQAYITSQFENLRDNDDFVDVTLACGGQKIGAHKVVLSACSPFFKELFKTNPCPHPIIFMRDVEPETIMSLLEFMYAGEVNVAQTNLTGFLRTAESLQIRGLTEANTKPKNYSTLDTKNFENYENKSNKVSSTKNEIENDKDVSNVIETINPISMLSQGHLNCEMDLVEPKMEPNEYVSEEEVEGETEDCHDETLQDYQNIAMENDNNSLPGTSAPSFDGFGNINSHGLKLSQKSGDPSTSLIRLGDGVVIREDQLRSVKWGDYRKLTRGLATILFSPIELATCSVTGQRWSRASSSNCGINRPVKPALPRHKVQALVSYVAQRFPHIEVSRIKQVLAYKCKENSTALKMKAVRYFGSDNPISQPANLEQRSPQ